MNQDGTRINFWGRETDKPIMRRPWSWWADAFPCLASRINRQFRVKPPSQQSSKRRATERREREKLALRGRALPLFAEVPGVDPVRVVLGMSLTELRGVLSREASWDEQVLGTRGGSSAAESVKPGELEVAGSNPARSGDPNNSVAVAQSVEPEHCSPETSVQVRTATPIIRNTSPTLRRVEPEAVAEALGAEIVTQPQQRLESTLVLRGCGPILGGFQTVPELRQLDEATQDRLGETQEVCRQVRDGEITVNQARVHFGFESLGTEGDVRLVSSPVVLNPAERAYYDRIVALEGDGEVEAGSFDNLCRGVLAENAGATPA